jgi:hypothetical protein
MAKKQSFGDKVGKGSSKEQKTYIKFVKSYRSEVNDSIRFSEKIMGIPNGENITDYLKKNKSVLK